MLLHPTRAGAVAARVDRSRPHLGTPACRRLARRYLRVSTPGRRLVWCSQ